MNIQAPFFISIMLLASLGTSQQTFASDPLENGVEVTGLSGNRGSEVRYYIDVPDKAISLVIEIIDGSGDADLYVKFNQEPNKSVFDCRPYQWGNRETCTFKPPQKGKYHIMLHGYSSYSGMSLKATFVVDDDGQDPPDPKDCELSDDQQALLTAHNNARSQGRNCGGSYYEPAPALVWNCKLDAAATKHTQDMVDNNFFSHTGSDGSQVSDRVRAQDYNYRLVGENIAAGYSSVERVMEGWLNSPGHCSNIMRSGYTEIGAEKISTSSADYPHYWTTVFGDQ
ncbi:CAP domain-containing protein [Hahella ganghwensis]|uniref:CAP domain-containing protein n=1 Tax=Hahella ganghwensis TaxID=286420 RepID=UPI0003772A6F|nr:CAP domain-containing protein [Hahella ganghwensis]